MQRMVVIGVGVGLVLAGCKGDKPASGAAAGTPAIACATLLTAADVATACGGAAPTVSDALRPDAKPAPGARDVVPRCELAVVWDGDSATRMVAAVRQFPTVERALGAAAFDRDFVTASDRREAEGGLQLGTTSGEAAGRKVMGAKGALSYSLTATGADATTRRCSDDGLLALARQVAGRLP